MRKLLTMFEKFIDTKIFKISLMTAFYLCISVAVILILMIGNFLFKVHFLDYWVDDGRLRPAIEKDKK